MNLAIKNKFAIVTGASAGLGKAIAFSLASQGAKVAIVGRNQEALAYVARKIEHVTDSKVLPIPGNMTIAESAKNMVRHVISEFGTVHILVNNIGQAFRAHFSKIRSVFWQESHNINLMSTVHVTENVIPIMQKQHWGRIICIAALSATEPSCELIASNVAKASLLNFSKTLSKELASSNILVNCVSPGLVKSPQNDRYFSDAERKKAFSRIPLGRFGDPDEFADVVTFLCSERASYITGINLIVDGGLSRSL